MVDTRQAVSPSQGLIYPSMHLLNPDGPNWDHRLAGVDQQVKLSSPWKGFQTLTGTDMLT